MKVLFGPSIANLEKAIPDLEKEFPDIEFVFNPNQEELPSLITDADVYVGAFFNGVFPAGQRLQWIQSSGTGVDLYLSIPGFMASGILLTNVRGTHAACVAESTFGMILAFTRGIRASIMGQQKHEWTDNVRASLIELTDSTLGIIGFGSVGRALASRASAFDMNIVAVALLPGNKPDYVNKLGGIEYLDYLLHVSDYVVVTAPLTPDTRNMIGAEQLALMKPSAMLLGVSRGGIIDQRALVNALRKKQLAAAALDVFELEPLPAESELWDLENLLITAHIAGGTQYAFRHSIDIFVENLRRFLHKDLPLRNQVDKKRGY